MAWMAAGCRWPLFLFSTCIALHAMQARSQRPGFLSVDCGSLSTTIYTDEDGIEWKGDSTLISDGRPMTITSDTVGSRVMSTMRLFDGNQSKYCYTLTDSAINFGTFLMVRVWFWAGSIPPYTPQNPDGIVRFKLILDADVWSDVAIRYGTGTDWFSQEVYVQAQRSSIYVCFARSTPGGDAPFVSALELRPLPFNLTFATVMINTSRTFVSLSRANFGVLSGSPSSTRYPLDPLDRIWHSFVSSPPNVITTKSNISTNEERDQLPATILQTAYTNGYITLNFSNLDPTLKYFAEFYFAEIDPAVNASGQRVFDIYANGDLLTTSGPIDVYGSVLENAAYGYPAVALPNADGVMTFNFTPTNMSFFQPFVSAAELFETYFLTPLTDSDTVNAIEDIKASLNLIGFRGDPCLPIGFGYSWLNCSKASAPTVRSISLSNYGTGGEIPESLNTLTTLQRIYLDGNKLQGGIPDLSALLDLEVLDLSNNELSGLIPAFLATLTYLEVLNLENNKFSGVVPAVLLQRKQASMLDLKLSGNPLCETNIDADCRSPPSYIDSNPQGSSPPSSKKSNSGAIVGAVVAVVLVVATVIGIAVYCFCRKRAASSLVISKNFIPKRSVREFSFEEIKNATDNFSTQLGMGGFGPVYKGTFQDGSFAAIKVASSSSHQGSKEFLNEVDLLSRVHHKNLVGLLGYCIEEKLVLVYEFMGNGSLLDRLHGPSAKAAPLPWGTRLRILVDAAQGLDYLHYGCNPRIIHRDVKSSNILLNDQLEAKISDFGISRNSFVNESGAPSTALMGSMGYMDPDYLATMRLTEKVDVYSFGVLLFEVLCGKAAVFIDTNKEQTHITEWAKSSIDRGVIDDIVDASLHGQYGASAVWKMLEIAVACVAFPGSARPKMSEVFSDLKEAERMELQSDQRAVFDKPSAEFTGGNENETWSFTHVSTR